MLSGENGTCNECLAPRKKWAGNNPEKNRELSQRYGEEHKEEKKVYNQEYNRREVDCEVCGCRMKKCNWRRHLETKTHLGVRNGEAGGDMGGEGGQDGEVELCPLDTDYCYSWVAKWSVSKFVFILQSHQNSEILSVVYPIYHQIPADPTF